MSLPQIPTASGFINTRRGFELGFGTSLSSMPPLPMVVLTRPIMSHSRQVLNVPRFALMEIGVIITLVCVSFLTSCVFTSREYPSCSRSRKQENQEPIHMPQTIRKSLFRCEECRHKSYEIAVKSTRLLTTVGRQAYGFC